MNLAVFLTVLLESAFVAQEAGNDRNFTAGVEELLPGLGSSDAGTVEKADRALERMCLEAGRPGAEKERGALASALSEKLGPDTSVSARLLLVRQLQMMGRLESVPALALLLSDEEHPHLREAARRALEVNPAPTALRVLRKAYPGSSGDFRTALILSLGARRDFLALGDLLADAQGDEREVRLAAFHALSLVGDRQAVDLLEVALERGGKDLPELKRLYLQLANSMFEGDEKGAARRIYLEALSMGPGERCRGLIGLGRAGIPSEAPLMLDALDDPDPRVRQAALEGLSSLRGSTAIIAERMPGASSRLRKNLAIVLGRRGDPVATPSLRPLTTDPDDQVRRAAVEALRQLGVQVDSEKPEK